MALEKLYDSNTKSFVETKMTDGSDMASETLNDISFKDENTPASLSDISSLFDKIKSVSRDVKKLKSTPETVYFQTALENLLINLLQTDSISAHYVKQISRILDQKVFEKTESPLDEEEFEKQFYELDGFVKPREGRFEKLAREAGALTDEKNKAYGDSFHKAGEFLALVYPNGITPDKYVDALCLVRIFDKLMRIGTKKDAFGESPYKDIMGYALLGLDNDERNKVLQAPKSDTREVKFADAPKYYTANDYQATKCTCGKGETCASCPLYPKKNIAPVLMDILEDTAKKMAVANHDFKDFKNREHQNALKCNCFGDKAICPGCAPWMFSKS